MQDKGLTEDQLLTELIALRQRVAKLEKSNADLKQAEKSLKKREERYRAILENRKRMEEALRESEERYRLLIETMNEGLGMVDSKGIRTFVNRKFCEMTGYPKEELIGYPAAKLYVEEENQKIFLEQRLKREKGKDDPYEIVITHKDGNKIQVLVSPKPVYDKDGQYVGSIATFTDITDRKKAEEKLRESEERYRLLIETMNEGLGMVDSKGIRTFVNRKFCEMTGYPKEELIGYPAAKLYVEEENQKNFLEQRLKREKGKDDPYEIVITHKDGNKIQVLVSPKPVYDKDGQYVGSIATFTDITDRKKAEEKLRESEERYRLLIETMNEGLGMVDSKGIRTFVNRKFCEMTGYPKEELIGYPAAKLYVEEENQKIFLEQRLKREKGKDDPYEIVITHKDGNKIQVLVSPKPVYDKDGQYVGSIATFTDITDRKKAEEKLRESEQRLHRVIQGSPIPTFVIGKDHRAIYWNKALEELSGIKAEEVIGTTDYWRAFYSKERPCLAVLLVDQALNEIPQWYFDKYVKSKLIEEAYEATDFFPELGGTGRWLRFTAAAIRDSQENLVGAIETLEDVTERKRAEEELMRVEKLESLGIFAGGIAHDFNNLLSVMLRNIFAAKLFVTDEQQEVLGEGLEIAEKAGLQAKELAHRLITFAKGGEPVRKIGSISQLLMNSVDLSLSGSISGVNFPCPMISGLWKWMMCRSGR